MISTRSTTITAALAATLAFGCIQKQDDQHPIARAIPTSEQVAIHLPQSATRTIGQLAPWYVSTRNVTRTFNGGTAWVLIVVHAIVQYPPTTTSGDTATWGPWSDGPLAPAEYRLTVTALGNGSYDWQLDGRSRTTAGSHFVSVIAGNAVPSNPEGTGSGRFTIDFDNGRLVNPVDGANDKGVIDVAYDLDARTLDMQISSTDAAGKPVDAHYTYAEAADRSGDMTFSMHGDTDDAGTAAEDGVIRSRWLSTGSGRADIRLSGGDLGNAQVTASECWDVNFAETYYTDSASFMPTVGDAGTCAYADQDLPPLS
jgi:hypothetical protein